MNRKALVTGATGLLGSNICRELHSQGWSVTAMVRSREKARWCLGDEGFTVLEADIRESERYATALDGVDTVFHTAAFFREYYQPGDHWETMKAINVDATMSLLHEAEKRGVRRVVHTSSSGVIEADPGVPADEGAEYSHFAEKNLYFKSKVMVEKEIFGFLKSSRVDVVLVLPGWMMGPGDAAPTSAGQMVIDLAKESLPGTINGGASLTDARDVAAAMVAAADRGIRGERYIVAGPLGTMPMIAEAVARVRGLEKTPGMLPDWIAMTAAWFSDRVASIRKTESRMPVAGIRTLLERQTLSSQKAIRELSASFRPLEETVRDTLGWFEKHGFLEPGAADGRQAATSNATRV